MRGLLKTGPKPRCILKVDSWGQVNLPFDPIDAPQRVELVFVSAGNGVTAPPKSVRTMETIATTPAVCIGDT
jgi:hypothetical protein